MPNTRTRMLPIPGLVLGSYPQKPDTPDANGFSTFVRGIVERQPLVGAVRLRRLRAQVTRVRAALNAVPLPDTPAFRIRLDDVRARMAAGGLHGEAVLDCMAMVLAVIRAATGRSLRDAQIIAALVAVRGDLAELPTGEGKTLGLALAAATAALAGVPVHAITSNDYLAVRDAQRLRGMYAALGLRAAAVQAGMDQRQKATAYGCHVVYASARELAFDYLRDGLQPLDRRLLPGLCMALVDEADSVLLDDATTPLVLAANAAQTYDPSDAYRAALHMVSDMREGEHFWVVPHAQCARLTRAGLDRAAACALASDHALWKLPRYREELLELAVQALHVLQRDRHYLVRAGRVQIIDATSGRVAHGRAWSRGLQQMVEIKERCDVSAASQTMRQATFQRLFRRYLHLGGMSGTLTEARSELLALYGSRVVRVPPSHESQLVTLPPLVFTTAQARWNAVLDDVAQRHARGQPVLIGTDSVLQSERLSRLLTDKNLPHTVLNARHDRQEAALVAAAGKKGAITVSTNMAGRGTDIVVTDEAVLLGGLHVISCQCNSSRRTDRQQVGRCARHGQPGSTQTMLSLEEGLLRQYVGERMRALAARCFGTDRSLPKGLVALAIRIVRALQERRSRQLRRDIQLSEQQQPRLVRAEVH